MRELDQKIRLLAMLVFVIMQNSCGFKSASIGANASRMENFISGIISPLLGFITEDNTKNMSIVSTAYATACADPVYVKLFQIKVDGSIDESAPLAVQLIGSDARFSFETSALGLSNTSSLVQYLLKAEGCNGDVFKRPITSFDNQQHLDAKSTIISEVVNAGPLVTSKLNKASKKEVQQLINSINGTSTATALNSLMTEPSVSEKFSEIFGTSPDVIQNARPEVTLTLPTQTINELAVSQFTSQIFHVDPTYSSAFKWKIDGVVKSSSSSWSYIPTANDSGPHTIDFYVGKDDGSGNIDLTKPYFTKTINIIVNNNVTPLAPNIVLNALNPSPVSSNTIQVDLSTGVALANCNTFSHLAITDTPTPPGIMQFNINCHTSGTQTESVTFSSGDSTKTLYLWAIDHEGAISPPKTVSFVLDSAAPVASISQSQTLVKGGGLQTITLSASDIGTGLSSLNLYFSSNGGSSYTLLSTLSHSATSYSWTVPSINTQNAIFKLTATDLTGLSTSAYSSIFEIDSSAPNSPSITRTSAASSNSTTVNISTICLADYHKILYSQSPTTPLMTDSTWENCTSTKTFIVSSIDGLKTIYAFTKDLSGNISTSSHITMTLDTTPPGVPSLARVSPAISSASSVTFTANDCSDRPFVLVSESMIPPLPSDSTWQTCSTSAAAISHTLLGPVIQGIHQLYLYAKDSVGNISASTYSSMIYDTTPPSLNLSTSLSSLYKGGDTIHLTFSTSDLNGISALNLEFSADGTNYSNVSSLVANSTTYSWNVPNSNTNNAKIRLVARDGATSTNNTVVESTLFTIDSTFPTAPTMTLTSQAITNSTSVTFNVSSPCGTDTVYLMIKEGTAPLANDTGWMACSNKTGTQSYTLENTTNGSRAITVYAKDLAGNITTGSSISVIFDNTPPVINLTSSQTSATGGSNKTLTWTTTEINASNTQNFNIEMFDGATWNTISTLALTNGPLTNASFSKTFAFPSYSTVATKIRLSFTDLAGNTGSALSETFTLDSTAPSMNSISINANATTTINKNILVSFTASDNIVPISEFCMKYNNYTTPTSNDSCWMPLGTIGVSPATNIAVTNFPFQLGSIQGDYDVMVWLKDSLGLISSLNNSGSGTHGIDRYNINYTPDPAPVITNFTASSTDTPSSPLSISDTTVTVGNDVYIKWSITDNVAIPNGNISLSYTTNDSTYTLISQSLNNNTNGSCSLNGSYSGCYKWSAASPSSAYYRIKLTVTDAGGATLYEVSNPINTGTVKFLSGNTSLGIGGMATNAILLGANENIYNDAADPQALVVTKTGFIFYRYVGRGLVYISPEDGILRDVAPQTGTISGDGGSVFNATFSLLGRIVKDYNDNIILWDGSNRIRKINTSTNPWTITTLFGGGSDTSDGALGLSANITSSNNDLLMTTPDGRIYFIKNREIWYYDPTDLRIKKYITLSGIGTGDMISFRATLDNVICPTYGIGSATLAFNITTSAITKIIRRISSSASSSCGSTAATFPYYNTNFNLSTGIAEAPHPPLSTWSSTKFTGMDGQIYELEQGRARLKRYNSTTNAFDTIIGTGTVGRCADGTAATSCNAVVMSAFVTELGKIYFIDLGVLRTIDPNGNIQTVAGQPRNFGIGNNPISARYSQINFFEVIGDDIYVKNDLENQITKFSLSGGNVTHIAGNTVRNSPVNNTDAKLTALPGCTWSAPCSFIIDSSRNRLYHYAQSPGVAYIDLATGKWVIQSTSGIQDGSTRVSYLGINPDGLIAYLPSHHGTPGNKVTIRMIDQTTLATTLIYGQDTALLSQSATLCNGVIGTDINCKINHTSDASIQTRYKYDATLGWLIGIRGTNSISQIPSLGGVINVFKTLNNTYLAYDYYKSGVDDFIFYCGSNGNLYKKNLTTNAEVLLSLPISTMKCTGNAIHYHQGRNSIIFAYVQNGLYGMAEYMSP